MNYPIQIIASKTGGEYSRMCTTCAGDVKLAASGVYDTNMHPATALHKTNEAKAKTDVPMASFFDM